MSLFDRVRYLLPLSLLLLVSVFVMFYRLGDAPLQDWDEGIYAVIAAEMAESGNWLRLTLMGAPWMEKPILPFWLEAGAFKLFGFSEFAARFFPALAGVGSVLLLYGLGRRLFSWYVGLWAALLFLVSPLFLDYHVARSGDHDVLFLFWLLLAIYAFVRSWDGNTRWFVGSGIAAGFAIATRGQMGLFAVLVPVITHGCLLLKARVRRKKQVTAYGYAWLWWFLAWFLLGGSWHLYAYYVYGSAFVDTYFTEQLMSRISAPLQGHGGPWWFYAQYLWEKEPFITASAALMSLLWLVRYGLRSAGWSGSRRLHFTPAIALLLVWVALYGFFTAVMATKLHWYLVGMLPALYLIAVSALKHPGAPRAFATVGVVALLAFYGWRLPQIADAAVVPAKEAALALRASAVPGMPLVVYRTFGWNFGRLLPAAYWYLRYSAGMEPLSVDEQNAAHYALSAQHTWWLLDAQYTAELMAYPSVNLEEIGRFDSVVLLRK